ncbi:hypothetical protein HMPREF0043_00012 [Actinobaculum sp. oral taxon 183 str. F0552]|nr:hypothetical protein HMPREF0043_00012 [Actinobaculum sp. oral taxon 183 str. F0552]
MRAAVQELREGTGIDRPESRLRRVAALSAGDPAVWEPSVRPYDR